LGYFSQIRKHLFFEYFAQGAAMRISDARYTRDRLRLDLALRFIQLEARTRTIRVWTGLTDDRIRRLVHSCTTDQGGSDVTRHRGKSPTQTTYFTRSPVLRQEAAILASLCYLLQVVPTGRVADAQRALPGVQRGEALCEAFEIYRRLVPGARIGFEHAVFLVIALARSDELAATLCSDCNGLIVVDRYAVPGRRCACCEASLQGRLPL
jgi:hypothetical protein